MKNIIRNKHLYKIKSIRKSVGIILLIFSIFTFLGITAEARWNLGRIVKSQEVVKQFEAGNLSEGYTYYYNGSKIKPDAIIGLSKEYRIKSKYWKPFNSDSDSVESLVKTVNQRRFFGAWLNDQNDEKMGAYFSKTKNVKIKMAGEKEIAYITLIKSHYPKINNR